VEARIAPPKGLGPETWQAWGRDGEAHMKGMSTGRDGQTGQGLLEYALVIVLVAVIVLIVIAVLGGSTGNLFSNVVFNV
jgi:pilus assembly protein Flp/PilA